MRFSLSFLDYAVILAYFAANLAVGFWSARRARKQSGMADYLLAGRGLSLPIFVAALVSSWYGGVLGVGEFSFRYGLLNWVVLGFPYYIFALIYAWFLAPRISASGALTLPELLEQFYGRKAAGVGAALLLLLVSPAPYILMIWVLVKSLAGVPLWACFFLTLISATAFLFMGGFRSDVRADVLHFLLMYSGLIVLPIAAYHAWGGLGFLRAHLPPTHLQWTGGKSWGYIGSWWFLGLWTLVEPTFYQKCLAAKSPQIARRGILISVMFWVIFDFITTVAGLYARAIIPNLKDPILSYPALADKILPPIWKGFFYVGMLGAIFAAFSSLAFLFASTLGRDLFWKFFKVPGLSETRHVQAGLIIGIVAGALIAVRVPSVIDIWYTFSSIAISGLLFPLCLGYFPAFKPRSQDAVWVMIGGSGIAALWTFLPKKPFGFAPIYPGLVVAASLYLYSLIRKRMEASHV
jgi:SSS family solute:Na+ symporter